MHDHFFINEAAQHGRYGGRVAIPHICIADQGKIGVQFLLMGGEKIRQRRRAAFFFALKENGDMTGQPALRHKGAAGFNKQHELALIIRSAARDDLLARWCLDKSGGKGIRLPQLKRIGRLHIIMPIKEHMRRLRILRARMGHNHGMTFGWAQAGFKANLIEIIDQPLSSSLTLPLIGRVSRDRGNGQKRKEARKRRLLIGVNGVKNGINLCHEGQG